MGLFLRVEGFFGGCLGWSMSVGSWGLSLEGAVGRLGPRGLRLVEGERRALIVDTRPLCPGLLHSPYCDTAHTFCTL